MNINTLQKVSHMKSRLLEITDVLLTDDVMSRQEIAFELLLEIESLNGVEGDLTTIFRKNNMRKLHDTVEKIEMEREKKRPDYME